MLFNMFAAAVFSNKLMPGQTQFKKYLNDYQKSVVYNSPYLLDSYHYIGNDKAATSIREVGRKVFLDSGAFSAKHSGAVIDINEYCRYVQKYEDIFLVEDGIPVIAALDVIGDAEQTWYNLKEMERQGLRALPTFHIHEDEKVLDYYANNYPYICIGGVAAVSNKQAEVWLDRLWERYLIDGAGRPKVKVHGFATTAIPIMRRYPWHCLTEEDHEVLTRDGWVTMDKVEPGEELYCFHEGQSFWDNVLETHCYPVVNETMHKWENRYIHAVSTPNHRWSMNYKNHRTGEARWEFRTSDNISHGCSIPRVGTRTDWPEKTITDAEASLMGWFWTEGSVRRRKRYKTDSIAIYQSEIVNPDKCRDIEFWLDLSGETYCKSVAHRTDGRVENTYELYGELCKRILDVCGSKKFPPMWWLHLLTKDQMELFVEASLLGDGTCKQNVRGERWSIYQKDRSYLDGFQYCLLSLGRPSRAHFSANSAGEHLVESNQLFARTNSGLDKRTVRYTGNVRCVTVPSGAFYVRSKGRVYVTGNSVDSSTWVQIAIYGGLWMPSGSIVKISSKSPSKHEAGKHFDTLTDIEKQHANDIIVGRGYDPEQLKENPFARAVFNLETYETVNKELNAEKETVGHHKYQEQLF